MELNFSGRTFDPGRYADGNERCGLYLHRTEDHQAIKATVYTARQNEHGIDYSLESFWTDIDMLAEPNLDSYINNPDTLRSSTPTVFRDTPWGRYVPEGFETVTVVPILRDDTGEVDRLFVFDNPDNPEVLPDDQQRRLSYERAVRVTESGKLLIDRESLGLPLSWNGDRRLYNEYRPEVVSLLDAIYCVRPRFHDHGDLQHRTPSIGQGETPDEPVEAVPRTLSDAMEVAGNTPGRNRPSSLSTSYLIGTSHGAPVSLTPAASMVLRPYERSADPSPVCAVAAHALARGEDVAVADGRDAPLLGPCRGGETPDPRDIPLEDLRAVDADVVIARFDEEDDPTEAFEHYARSNAVFCGIVPDEELFCEVTVRGYSNTRALRPILPGWYRQLGPVAPEERFVRTMRRPSSDEDDGEDDQVDEQRFRYAPWDDRTAHGGENELPYL